MCGSMIARRVLQLRFSYQYLPIRLASRGFISKISIPCIFPRISKRSRPVACSRSVGTVPGAAPGGRRSDSLLISVYTISSANIPQRSHDRELGVWVKVRCRRCCRGGQYHQRPRFCLQGRLVWDHNSRVWLPCSRHLFDRDVVSLPLLPSCLSQVTWARVTYVSRRNS